MLSRRPIVTSPTVKPIPPSERSAAQRLTPTKSAATANPTRNESATAMYRVSRTSRNPRLENHQRFAQNPAVLVSSTKSRTSAPITAAGPSHHGRPPGGAVRVTPEASRCRNRANPRARDQTDADGRRNRTPSVTLFPMQIAPATIPLFAVFVRGVRRGADTREELHSVLVCSLGSGSSGNATLIRGASGRTDPDRLRRAVSSLGQESGAARCPTRRDRRRLPLARALRPHPVRTAAPRIVGQCQSSPGASYSRPTHPGSATSSRMSSMQTRRARLAI